MARDIALRLSRPSTALMLFCGCLMAAVGIQAVEAGGHGSLGALVASLTAPLASAGSGSTGPSTPGGRATAARAADVAPQLAPGVETTFTFQQGVNGYAGTVDTWIDEQNPAASNATATTLRVDLLAYYQQALIRFDGIFGSGTGQIPAGST